jgi:DNA-binding NarL/FixJ family response regulator
MERLAQEIEDLEPDVVLLELEIPDNGTAPPELLTLSSGLHAGAIVVLADDLQGPWVAQALRSGVRAVLPSQATPGEIVAAVEAAAAGLLVLHPDASDTVQSAPPPVMRALPLSTHQALTAREIEVLSMMAEGLGNKSIAARLGISEHTVKFHIASIFTKLKATSRTEAVTLGIRQGLILL